MTAFTLGHSVTLWLATVGWVDPPGRWVESVIAASIVVAALATLRPIPRLSGPKIALAFGLIHGFGFSTVLRELGLNPGTLAVALFGFNVGVELGQLAIVLVVFPAVYALRNTAFYRRGVLPVVAVLIALLAAVWLVERAGNVEILGW